MNDEAHHAYRIKRDEPDPEEEEDSAKRKRRRNSSKEATVWIDGLDRMQKQRGINFCVDLSATPYFLGRVGQETNKPFPWVVSDFGLIDAIESGLVKIPQLAVRDTTGAEIPATSTSGSGFWNRSLHPPSGAASRGSPKPEAILKYAHHPIAMLGGLWEKRDCRIGQRNEADPRPPVFILVCKNTRIAKAIYEWLAEDKSPTGIPPGTCRRLPEQERASEHHSSGHRKSYTRRIWRALRAMNFGGCGSRWIPWERPAGPRPAGAAALSRRLRGTGEEARTTVASAGTRRALHRQRGNAHRRMGLQYGDAHHRTPAVHVAASLRTGRGSRTATGEL